MHGLTKKLLTILLSLLLSLAPLQGVFASLSSDCDHEGGMHQSVNNHASTLGLGADQIKQDCPHCDTVADCSGQCSSNHYVVAGLLPATFYTVQSIALSVLPSVRDGVANQIPSLLFRPPRS